MAHKIAYIVSRFPHLPETFILREMICLEKLGWQLELYPLIHQQQAVVHEESHAWVERAHVIPWFSLDLVRANLAKLISRPHQYLSLFWRVVRENIRSPKFLARAFLLFPRAVWMADRFRADGIEHVHAHYATHTALVAWLIHQFSGITYSMTVHAHDIFVERPMLATKLHDSVFVSTVSEFNRKYLADLFGPWVNEKTKLVRSGVEPSYYPITDQAAAGDSNRLEIISTGSLQPYKGQIYLVRACAKLKERGIPFRCRIVGGGDLRKMLEEATREYHLEEYVELLGPRTQEEVSQFLRTANCYVQPSIITPSGKMEGLPVALVEAMASRIPVVATAISGIPELVRPGETGWLVSPEDADGLADALTEVYKNPAEAVRRADRGRQLVLEEYEISSNVQKLASLFDGI